MSANLFLQPLKQIPLPIFGTAATATVLSQRYAASIVRLSKMAIPLGAGALWFIWPAIDDNWKQSIGLGPSKVQSSPAAAPAKVELSKEALKKIETAYITQGDEELSEEEQATLAAISKGDFSSLEQDWDKFIVKVMVPGDGDDEEDEEEEEDESEEEVEESEEDADEESEDEE